MRTTLILFLFFLSSTPLFAESEAPPKLEPETEQKTAKKTTEATPDTTAKKGQFSFDFGLGLTQGVLQVKEGGQDLGELRSDLEAGPVLIAASPLKYFGDRSIGFKFVLSYTSWKLHKQQVSNVPGQDLEDIGTSAEGYSIYALPVIGITHFDRQIVDGKGKSLLLGLGLGASYVDVNGTIRLTNSPGSPLHSFDLKQFAFSILFIVNYQWNNWTIGSQVGGPFVKKNGFTYGLFEITPRISYTLYF